MAVETNWCLIDLVKRSEWFYPLSCAAGHEWRPGKVVVGWTPCMCAGTMGHLRVHCTVPGCYETWYAPPHKADG